MTNDSTLTVGENTDEQVMSVDILDGETIEVEASVCLNEEITGGQKG